MTIQSQTSNISIRPILYANAVFSGLSGLIFSVASKAISAFLGIDAPIIILAIGLDLIVFAGLLYYFGSRPTISRNFVLFAIIADSIWVLGSILLLLTDWAALSVEGKWAVGILAIIVDIFAALQFFKWQKVD